MASEEPKQDPLSGLCKIIEGCPIPKFFSDEAFLSAISYKPRPDDVFIVTYPKCGTTWAQNILVLIFNQGKPIDAATFYTAAPYLEMGGAELAEKMPRPGAIKVHLPYRLTPWSNQAKYIYVTRNPRDCCVSYFHQEKGMPESPFRGNFDDFFELFINGTIHYGDYFDHLLDWYAHRNDPNVLFLTYEEMKENPEESVLKLASFIDDEKYAEPLRKDRLKLDNVLKYSSFSYMQKMFNGGMSDLLKMSPEDLAKSEIPDEMKRFFTKLNEKEKTDEPKKPPSDFVRKGIVGDWKNYFSQDQCERLNKKFAERTKGTDIPKLWEKYM